MTFVFPSSIINHNTQKRMKRGTEMKTFFTKYKYAFILAMIILLQLFYITYMFCQREGWHTDEAWSYGFANADHQTGIYHDNNGTVTNYNTWLDSKTFKDYIEVQEGHSFQFDAVYYNSTAEHNNPPLHNMLLHAVCSFFPDSFSWWYSYIINAACFILAMIALFNLVKALNHSQTIALFTCFFYGSTTAALNTFIFLRMYALTTALAILLCYIHIQLYNKQFQKCCLWYVHLFIIMFLGGFSQYIFLFLGFFMTLGFSIYLLFQKRWKALLRYDAAMALSALTVLVFWSHDIKKFTNLSSIYGTDMPYIWEVKYCLQRTFNETLGIWLPYLNPLRKAILLITFVYLLIIGGGLCFLLRKNKGFQSIVRSIPSKLSSFFKTVPSRFRNMNKLYLIFTFSWVGTLLVIAKTCNIFSMGSYADRYLFCLFPIVAVLFICLLSKFLCYLGTRFTKKPKTFHYISLLCILCMLIGINHVYYPCNYLFKRECDKPVISEIVEDSNVILVTKHIGYLPYYPPMFLNIKKVFVTSPFDDVESSLQSLNDLEDTSSPCYLVIETNHFLAEDFIRDESKPDYIYNSFDEALCSPYKVSEFVDIIIKNCNWADRNDFIQKESSFRGPLSVYRIH